MASARTITRSSGFSRLMLFSSMSAVWNRTKTKTNLVSTSPAETERQEPRKQTRRRTMTWNSSPISSRMCFRATDDDPRISCDAARHTGGQNERRKRRGLLLD